MQIVTVSKDDEDPSLFYAAQVSVGMLGIITEITFPVVPKFTLIEYRTKHSLTYCLDNLDSIVMGVNVGYVKLWVDYYNDFCLVFNQTRTSEPPRHHRILLEIKGFLMVRIGFYFSGKGGQHRGEASPQNTFFPPIDDWA